MLADNIPHSESMDADFVLFTLCLAASAENEPQTDNDQGAEAEARKPKSETETETKKNNPETGDECNPTLWTALLLLSIVALAELNDKRKKLK